MVDAVTAPAKAVASSLGTAEQQAKTLTSAMASLEKQMTKASALGDTEKIAALNEKMGAFGGALQKLGPDAQDTTATLGDLKGMIADLPLGITAAVAALVAIGSALVAATIGGAKLALEMGELREKTLATFSALAGGAAAGASTLAMVDALRDKLGMTRAEMAPFANELLGMGYQGKALETQLTALASAKSIGGEGGVAEYTGVLKKLSSQATVSQKDLTSLYKTGVNSAEMAALMGVSTAKLAKDLKNGTVNAKAFGDALTKAVTAKGAKALEAQANSLTAQMALLKENLGQMFEGVDAGPFLSGLKDIFGLFSQNTASGQAMGVMIRGAFTAILKVAAKVLPYIKIGLELMVIAGLKAYIALKKFFGGEQGAMRLKVALGVLAVAVTSVLAPVLMLAGGLAAGMVIAGIVGAALVSLGADLLTFAGSAIQAGIDFVDGLVDSVTSSLPSMGQLGSSVLAFLISPLDGLMSLGASIASNFVIGLVNGVTGGATKIVNAAKEMGGAMLDGVKSVLGIHSPSLEMKRLGGHTATGFAQGVQGGMQHVDAASQSLSAAAMSGTASASSSTPSAAPAASSSGLNVTVMAGAIVINGAQGDATELTEQALTLAFERIALSQGLGGAA
jgi:hypothetical protein